MANPPVLFLDEPTTGLDPSSRARMWQVVRELVADGATVLLTTQYFLKYARHAMIDVFLSFLFLAAMWGYVGAVRGDRRRFLILGAAAVANLASWRTPGAFDGARTFPFGAFPADAAAMMNLSEVVVHTWDIAVALGADTTIDPAVAKMLDEFYAAISLDPYRAHGAFGPAVAVDPGASHADRLLAHLGRQPVAS